MQREVRFILAGCSGLSAGEQPAQFMETFNLLTIAFTTITFNVEYLPWLN